jgi:hypothetical protein
MEHVDYGPDMAWLLFKYNGSPRNHGRFLDVPSAPLIVSGLHDAPSHIP